MRIGSEIYGAGADAADALLPPAYVAKANPLTIVGFDAVVRGLVRLIAKDARAADRAALATAATRLDARWPDLKAAERAKILRAAAGSIAAVPKVVITPVTRTLYNSAGDIAATAKRITGNRVRIAATFNEADLRVVGFAARSQAAYITDQYGNRAVAFEQRARDIVAKGLEAGYDRHDIGKLLKAQLIDPSLRTADSYWESVASIHAARARAYGQLAALHEADIERFEFVAVLDEVTTLQCRMLHGRTFSVAAARKRYDDVEASDDPYAVKSMQPFLSIGKTDDGGQYVFADTGGRRTIVGRVGRSGYGTVDDTGDFTHVASDKKLEELGCTTPPLHARCRSTIVPA